jgi:hypothetical protein
MSDWHTYISTTNNTATCFNTNNISISTTNICNTNTIYTYSASIYTNSTNASIKPITYYTPSYVYAPLQTININFNYKPKQRIPLRFSCQ